MTKIPDMKEWVQNRAEELALKDFNTEYDGLDSNTRQAVYAAAMNDWADYYASMIDAAVDRLDEGKLITKCEVPEMD